MFAPFILVISTGLGLASIGMGLWLRKPKAPTPTQPDPARPMLQPRDANGRFVARKVAVHEALRRDVAARKAQS